MGNKWNECNVSIKPVHISTNIKHNTVTIFKWRFRYVMRNIRQLQYKRPYNLFIPNESHTRFHRHNRIH